MKEMSSQAAQLQEIMGFFKIDSRVQVQRLAPVKPVRATVPVSKPLAVPQMAGECLRFCF